MEYQERLLMEYTELVSKFNKLECFIKYNKIDKEKEELMNRQLDVMMNYRSILEQRILLEMKKGINEN